jgi:hypothetical protein
LGDGDAITFGDDVHRFGKIFPACHFQVTIQHEQMQITLDLISPIEIENKTKVPFNAPASSNGTDVCAELSFNEDFRVLAHTLDYSLYLADPPLNHDSPLSHYRKVIGSDIGKRMTPTPSICPNVSWVQPFSQNRNKTSDTPPISSVHLNKRGPRQKIKRGLPGFVNGFKVSAMADTGSAQNIISAGYASAMKFNILPSSSSFKLGNSKSIQAIGKPYAT